MKRLSILLGLALIAACTPRVNTNPTTGGVDVDMEPITQSGQVWETTLSGSAGITGSSRAEVQDDHTMTTINITGAQSGAVHPWHIHEGSCASGGGIVGSASAYPPLQVGTNGQGQAQAHVAVALNEARPYHINVHASPSDMGTIVACGDLDDD